MTAVYGPDVSLPYVRFDRWPLTTHRDQTMWAVEVIIRTLHDTEDPQLYDVLRALVRPDMGSLDMIEHVRLLAELSQAAWDAEEHGPEALEVAREEYADALDRFIARPSDALMTVVRALQPNEQQPVDELAARRR